MTRVRAIDANELMELYTNTPDLKLDDFSVPIPVIRQNINDMPTIEVEPNRHGKWSHVEYGVANRLMSYGNATWTTGYIISEDRWQCSVCRKYKNVLEKYDFCPNCGARMDLEG